MLAVIAASAILGLLGFDPAGGLFAAAALVVGARIRHVLLFGAIVLVLSAAYIIVLAITVGQQIAGFDWSVLLTGNWWRAAAELLLAAIAVGIGWYRLRHRLSAQTPPRTGGIRVGPLALAGVVYSTLSFTDPTFAATIVLAGRHANLAETFVAGLVWSAVSQLLLSILMVAMCFGVHRPAVEVLQRLWARVRVRIHALTTLALLVVALFLVVDTGWFVATGRFLIHR
ncbi:MAG: hypothetical protein ABI137_00105 [Antricoccus sp.]